MLWMNEGLLAAELPCSSVEFSPLLFRKSGGMSSINSHENNIKLQVAKLNGRHFCGVVLIDHDVQA